MKNKIRELEQEARKLEPPSDQRQSFSKKVFSYGEEFLDNLDQIPAYQETEDQGSGIYDHPIKDSSADLEKLLEIVKENVDTPGLNPASPCHLGYIPGGGIFPSALGDYLAAVSNRYAGVFFASPGAVRMENQLIDWMSSLIGYEPGESGGNLTSGGSLANLIGITAARDNSPIPMDKFDEAVIYATSHSHHCIHKALNLLGLQTTALRHIDLDDQFRMDVGALARQIEADKKDGLRPFLITATAGTTNVGAVDPIEELSEIADQHNLWLHVDAAYGGFFRLCEEGRKSIHGLQKADSVIMDPHKGLFLPYGSGAVLVKDKNTLYQSQHYTADYMQDAYKHQQEISPADMSPELSKHFRGMRMWLPLQLFGLKPFRAALEEKIWLARYLHQQLQEIDRMEVSPYPELSILFFRYLPEQGDPEEFNARFLEHLRDDGRIFLSSTRIDGNYFIRAAVMNFRTHLEHIDKVVSIIREKIETMES